MNINPCLLDISNSRVIDGAPISRRIRDRLKECLWSKRQAPDVDTVVIHYISAVDIDPRRKFDLDLVLRIFCDFVVSSHYLIARNGEAYRLVPEDKKAWHCGGSIMPPPDLRQSVNDFSIGIELVATEESGFTKKQYAALGSLCADIETRYAKKISYVGHADIAGQTAVDLGLRTDVKTDPGNRFNWNVFKELLGARKTSPC
jgi:N-acetyl-anhydromuramyl-L-alanine amidase AmpD